MQKLIILFKRFILWSLITVLITVANFYFYKIVTHNQIFYSPAALKNYHHVLVLGAGKNNPVFYTRMNAVLQLYSKGTISQITCSGLTGVVNYSEPYDMRNYLLQNHVPDNIIQVDIDGKHTFNSVINYAKLHPGDSVIIVSQAQHLQRALLIANCTGLKAAGFGAFGFKGGYNREWVLTEYLSRIKCTFYLIYYYLAHSK